MSVRRFQLLISLALGVAVGGRVGSAEARQKRIAPQRVASNQDSALAPSYAGHFGAGLVLGEPTALTGKYWWSAKDAVDVGLSFFQSNFILVYGDYLRHFAGIWGRSSPFVAHLQPYAGIGAFFASIANVNSYDAPYFYHPSSSASSAFAVRIPLGVEWDPSQVPLGVFAELVPGVGISPGTFAVFELGLGVRYYF